MRIVALSETPQSVVTTAHLLNGHPPAPGKMYWLQVGSTGLTSMYTRESTKVFSGYLNELVKEWMRCGKKIVPPNLSVRAEAERSSKNAEWEWTLHLEPEGSGLKNPELLKPVDESDPAFSSWIWRVYWDYLWRFKPNFSFDSYGKVSFQYLTSAHEEPSTPIAIPPFLDDESAKSAAWLEAVLWFILLLNSGHAQLLDQCRFCGRYFVRQREMKKGQSYKRGGPNCGNCKGEGSKARTKAVRADAKDRMLDVAAEAWATWKKTHKAPNRVSAVAKRVNAECRDEINATTRRDQIESQWVKRNEKEILARLDRNAIGSEANQNVKGK